MAKVIRMAALAVVLALNWLVPSAIVPHNSLGVLQSLAEGEENGNNNNTASVPEPAPIILLGAGLACVAVMARRKQRKP